MMMDGGGGGRSSGGGGGADESGGGGGATRSGGGGGGDGSRSCGGAMSCRVVSLTPFSKWPFMLHCKVEAAKYSYTTRLGARKSGSRNGANPQNDEKINQNDLEPYSVPG